MKLNKFRKGTAKIFAAILGVIILNVIGCAARVVKIPVEDRIECLITPMKDLTGSYDPVSPKLETLIQQEGDSDFAKYEYRGTSSSYDKRIYVTNHFIIHKLLPENSRKLEDDPSLYKASTFDLLITGTVQQIKYGTPTEISKYFVDAWLFGIWGVLVREEAEQTNVNRAALVEYNFKVFDAKTRKKIASFTIQGAEKLPINDRERIVLLANKKVAQGLLVKLNTEVAKVYKNIEPRKYFKVGQNYYKW